MQLTLTSAEIQQVHQCSNILASPFEYDSVDAWRSAANVAVRELVGAESALFALPSEPTLVYSDEQPAEVVKDYVEVIYLDPAWERISGIKVDVYDRNILGFERSMMLRHWFYQEFYVAKKWLECVGMRSLFPEDSSGGAISLISDQVWSDDRMARASAMLSLLQPSLKAGVRTQGKLGNLRHELIHFVDAVGEGIAVFDLHASLLHMNDALRAMLARDPEGEVLFGEMKNLAAIHLRSDHTELPLACIEPRTRTGHYRIRVTRIERKARHGNPFLIVSLEALTPAWLADAELQQRYGLSPREIQVARLLAGGRTTREIAEALGIRPNTARHHVEHVFGKLNVHARSQVADRLRA